jgi:hypothetical protein
MKSAPFLSTCLVALFLLAAPASSQADEGPFCKISLAALSLPAGSDGLLHWIGKEPESEPLQLSTRYFSNRFEPKSGLLRLYASPTVIEEGEPIPPPLLTIKVPSGNGLVYAVLWGEKNADGNTTWHSRTFTARDWKRGTLKLINASRETLGLMVGEKKIKLPGGKSYDFTAREWPKPFPAKIYLTEPEMRRVFSSTWRVTAASRELCFVAKVRGAVSLRSLIDLGQPPEPREP